MRCCNGGCGQRQHFWPAPNVLWPATCSAKGLSFWMMNAREAAEGVNLRQPSQLLAGAVV